MAANQRSPATYDERSGAMNQGTAVPMPQCPYCGSVPHQFIGQCPGVAKIEYYPDGTIKSVEKRDGY